MFQRLKSLFFGGKRSINNPSVPLTADQIVNYLGNQGANRTGVNVNKSSVFSSAPVWQAVTQISGDLAKMKINLFENVDDVRTQVENSLSEIVHRPNEQQNWNKFWKRFWVQSLIWNRGYIWISRNPNGDPRGLYCLKSDSTEWLEEHQVYSTYVDNKLVALFPSEVIEVEGIQLEDSNSCELLTKFRESIALGLAAQGHNAKFFGNGGQLGGILMIPPQVSKEAGDKLEQGWRRKYNNEEAWFKTAILRDGVKFMPTGVDPEKSQLSQVRQDQVYEVARWFNLSPSRLGLNDASSYNSKHEDNQNYLDMTLSPWMASLTSELAFKLLPPADQGKQYFAFDTTQLLALNPKLRAETNKIRIDMGEISPNEARVENGLAPREGGDNYRLPSGVMIEGENVEVEEPQEPQEQIQQPENVEEVLEAGPVSAQALNGAQIGGLLEILEAVSTGSISKSSAVAMVMVAFPTIPITQASAIVDGAIVQKEETDPDEVSEPVRFRMRQSIEERAIAEIKKQTNAHLGKFEKIIRERAAKKTPEDFQSWLEQKTERGLAIPLQFRNEVDLTVTEGMVEEAKRGLEWREEYGRGGTQVGVTRANQIINDGKLSEETWKRVKSYFSRHEVDKQGEGFSPGENGFPSAGRIAWALWGGDAGFSRSKAIVARLEAAEDE
jgi:HK97 family phage portal protein